MKRLTVLLPMLLLATPAAAQQVPESAMKDLWCGLALTIAASEVPADATEEQKASVVPFVEGAEMLVARATGAYLEAGFTAESFALHRAAIEPEIESQITGGGGDAAYSFEECSALLGL
jgi:hypothetical protein